MKRTTAAIFLLVSCVVVFPNIVNAIGFEGIGGKVALVFPDVYDTTIGLGAIADLGTIVPSLKDLKAEVGADYWGNSKNLVGGTSSFTSITLSGTAKYCFPIGMSITPFAGGGLGINITRASYDWKGEPVYGVNLDNSNSDLDLGLHLVGGIDMLLGSALKLTAGAKFATGGVDAFQIFGGLVLKLK